MHDTSSRLKFGLLTLVSVALLVACSSAASPAPASAVPPVASPLASMAPSMAPSSPASALPVSGSPLPAAAVLITGTAFAPQLVTIPLGVTVTWTNSDTVDHDVTFDTIDNSTQHPVTANGGTFSYTPTAAGTFTYHSSLNPALTGTVVVTPN